MFAKYLVQFAKYLVQFATQVFQVGREYTEYFFSKSVGKVHEKYDSEDPASFL